jgi:hypothetical protein
LQALLQRLEHSTFAASSRANGRLNLSTISCKKSLHHDQARIGFPRRIRWQHAAQLQHVERGSARLFWALVGKLARAKFREQAPGLRPLANEVKL